jgi:hypothetical protein
MLASSPLLFPVSARVTAFGGYCSQGRIYRLVWLSNCPVSGLRECARDCDGFHKCGDALAGVANVVDDYQAAIVLEQVAVSFVSETIERNGLARLVGDTVRAGNRFCRNTALVVFPLTG